MEQTSSDILVAVTIAHALQLIKNVASLMQAKMSKANSAWQKIRNCIQWRSRKFILELMLTMNTHIGTGYAKHQPQPSWQRWQENKWRLIYLVVNKHLGRSFGLKYSSGWFTSPLLVGFSLFQSLWYLVLSSTCCSFSLCGGTFMSC